MTNMSDQITNVINQIAEKLGVAAEKVYPVLKKQAYVEGIANIFWIIVIAGITVAIVCNLWKLFAEWQNAYGDEDWFIGRMIACLIVVSIGLLFMPSIKNTITVFVNPDWYIFSQLLTKLVK